MLISGLERGHLEGTDTNDLVAALGSKHVLGRVGSPHEIGEAILFLADSQKSSFITGQALVVDGGALARLSTE
jgi:NAD(P)-dependent dehydrogenase (short-subunit alcohol dehydrogenase family)